MRFNISHFRIISKNNLLSQVALKHNKNSSKYLGGNNLKSTCYTLSPVIVGSKLKPTCYFKSYTRSYTNEVKESGIASIGFATYGCSERIECSKPKGERFYLGDNCNISKNSISSDIAPSALRKESEMRPLQSSFLSIIMFMILLPICGPCVILSLPILLIMAICGSNSIITLLLYLLFSPILLPAILLLSLINIDMMPKRI